jgi:protein-disulfide isomerase
MRAMKKQIFETREVYMLERKLLSISCILIFLLSLLVVLLKFNSKPIDIDERDHFTYGDFKAKNHMILFEEFACPSCREFSKKTLPTIEKTFVDSGRLKVTIIPLAFFEESYQACAIALTLKKSDPSRFRPFLDFVYSLPEENLTSFSFRDLLSGYLEIDSALPAAKILNLLKINDFNTEIERNIQIAESFYKGSVKVPIVILNGKFLTDKSYEAICKELNETL